MEFNTHFIPQNVAPYSAQQIGVYNKRGKKVGYIPLGNLALPSNLGNKLYSFGCISDIHLEYETAQDDFRKALTYFNESEDVDFTCICGDLTYDGQHEDFLVYQNYIETYSPNTPVYEITGNHDVRTQRAETNDFLKPYTGHDLCYTITQGEDVFIFFGMSGWMSLTGSTFTQETLQWLYETLEANRNKRCFVFEHLQRANGSGGQYITGENALLSETDGTVFKSLMEHYTNVIWFHGHSHIKFDEQENVSFANYDRMHGCHSVHIPSLAVPRDYIDGTTTDMYAESEGYIVDVYENHIVLRGRDFIKEKFLPIATYCIGTTLQTIPAGTYTDSTGTITT
jgi:3',5'-cyclic AMP phosphodiesterase CpdA